jgi:hypothetical protein
MEILVRLLNAGAKANKIDLAVTRTEMEKVQIFDLKRFKVFTLPFCKSFVYGMVSWSLLTCVQCSLETSFRRS